ncbi:hypothetical protein H0A71_22270 [Alcaligenaceae bacterium]|nr:hypothetical protein [Alcaligenaceae bacterium]
MNHEDKEDAGQENEASEGLWAERAEQLAGLNEEMLIEKLALIRHARLSEESDDVDDSNADRPTPTHVTMEQCLQEARDEIDGLLTRIDEILFYKWDPICLSNSNVARSEYTTYAPEVLKLTLESTSSQPLADHLAYLSTSIIGMPVSKECESAVAELIFCIVHQYTHFPDHMVIDVD